MFVHQKQTRMYAFSVYVCVSKTTRMYAFIVYVCVSELSRMYAFIVYVSVLKTHICAYNAYVYVSKTDTATDKLAIRILAMKRYI